ncbi:MAG: hypothetical protein EOP86_28330, partial [Verrucomicrobiaceae bacterium]
IIQSYYNKGRATGSGPPAVTLDPLLAPLGEYGGPTRTMALRAGSPAINAAAGSMAVTDQRGSFMTGTPDLGAYETGAPPVYRAWSMETGGAVLDPVADPDHDGLPNSLEYALGGNPLAPDRAGLTGPSPLPAATDPAAPAMRLDFPWRAAAVDLRYVLQRTASPDDPGSWTDVFTLIPPLAATHGSGVSSTLDVSSGTVRVFDKNINAPSGFWRLRVQPVP